MYPSRNPYQNQIIVKNTSDLMGQIDSSKVYFLDGNIDLGDDFIDVPETGITIAGFGSNISGLSANGKIFGFTGAYSGRIKTIGIGLSSPFVFDVDGGGQGNSSVSSYTASGNASGVAAGDTFLLVFTNISRNDAS